MKERFIRWLERNGMDEKLFGLLPFDDQVSVIDMWLKEEYGI